MQHECAASCIGVKPLIMQLLSGQRHVRAKSTLTALMWHKGGKAAHVDPIRGKPDPAITRALRQYPNCSQGQTWLAEAAAPCCCPAAGPGKHQLQRHSCCLEAMPAAALPPECAEKALQHLCCLQWKRQHAAAAMQHCLYFAALVWVAACWSWSDVLVGWSDVLVGWMKCCCLTVMAEVDGCEQNMGGLNAEGIDCCAAFNAGG